MMELIQFPWSPYCIAQRRILQASGVRFKITNIPNGDRTLVWKVTRQRYYQVPVLRDGRSVLFETDGDSQVIAKYIDSQLGLGLFPAEWEGVQSILWRYIENDLEGLGFKLNDIYWPEFVAKSDTLGFVRHKERKFGRGCLEAWRAVQPQLLAEFADKLAPFEQMLLGKPFLLGPRPYFVDFCLLGVIENFLYSGHYELPAWDGRLRDWHRRMDKLRLARQPNDKRSGGV